MEIVAFQHVGLFMLLSQSNDYDFVVGEYGGTLRLGPKINEIDEICHF